MPVVWSFTGTQNGMTRRQSEALATILDLPSGFGHVLHHGDCIGSDAEADAIVKRLLAWLGCQIHPSNIPGKRAHCEWVPDLQPKPPLSPLERNLNIVAGGTVLLATPEQAEEQIRSGTWMTIRCARRALKPVVIIQPNGVLRVERPKQPPTFARVGPPEDLLEVMLA